MVAAVLVEYDTMLDAGFSVEFALLDIEMLVLVLFDI